MSSFAPYSPMPMLALFKGGRAWSLLLIRTGSCLSWPVMSMLAIQYVGHNPYGAGIHPVPLIGLVLMLFGLPAGVGALLADVRNEVLRYPVTLRLPGIQVRTRQASQVIGFVSILLLPVATVLISRATGFSLAHSVERPPSFGGCLLLASLGFLHGSWMNYPVRPAQFLLRFSILLVVSCTAPFALTLGGSRPLLILGLGACASAWFMTKLRHEERASLVAAENANWNFLRGFQQPQLQEQAHRAAAKRIEMSRPRPVPTLLGQSDKGWVAAENYTSAMGSRMGMSLLLSLMSVGIVLVIESVYWALPMHSTTRSWAVILSDLLLTPLDRRATFLAPVLALLPAAWMAGAALQASIPIRGAALLPLSRKRRAKLVTRKALWSAPCMVGSWSALCLGLGYGLGWLGDAPMKDELPGVLFVAFALLLLQPFYVVISLKLRPKTLGKRFPVILSAYLATIVVAPLPIAIASQYIVASSPSGYQWPITLGAAALLVTAYASMVRFIRHHFREADLA